MFNPPGPEEGLTSSVQFSSEAQPELPSTEPGDPPHTRRRRARPTSPAQPHTPHVTTHDAHATGRSTGNKKSSPRYEKMILRASLFKHHAITLRGRERGRRDDRTAGYNAARSCAPHQIHPTIPAQSAHKPLHKPAKDAERRPLHVPAKHAEKRTKPLRKPRLVSSTAPGA